MIDASFEGTYAAEIEGPPWPPPPTTKSMLQEIESFVARFPPMFPSDGQLAMIAVGRLMVRVDELEKRVKQLEAARLPRSH